jgi:hypothetical protein
VGQAVRDHFASQGAETAYWPDDAEVRGELAAMAVYRKLSRARLRMVLESIEDHWRGWVAGQTSAAGMRIRRASYAIEHLMPQSWLKHWPLTPGVPEPERETRIHRLGNLTLLTKKLNSTISNGPWLGPKGKAEHLQEKDVVLLNSKVLKQHQGNQWDESAIDARTADAIDAILAIWPVPPGHKVSIARKQTEGSVYVEVRDLIGAGHLAVGQTLYSRPGKYGGHTATVLSDGRIEAAGEIHDSLSRAGIAIRKMHTNGWKFWGLQPNGQQPLSELRGEYLEEIAAKVDD